MAFTRKQYKGNVSYTDTLAGSMGVADTSFSLHDGTSFPDGSIGAFVVTIDQGNVGEEKILCASRNGAGFTVAAGGRGYDQTTAVGHVSGASVIHTISAVDMDEANHLVYSLLNGGTTGQVVTVDTTLTPPIKLATSLIASVFGRTGAVVATSGDYTASQVGALPSGLAIKATRTYAVSGLVAVASGAMNFLPPFYEPVDAGTTKKLAGVRYGIRAGTSATLAVTQNGTNVSGLGALSATTTPTTTAPTVAPGVTDGDSFAIVVSAVSGGPDGLSVSLIFETTL